MKEFHSSVIWILSIVIAVAALVFYKTNNNPKNIVVATIERDEVLDITLEKRGSGDFYGFVWFYKADRTVEIRLGINSFRNDLAKFDFIKYKGNYSEGLVSYQLNGDYNHESWGIGMFSHSEWFQVLEFVSDWPELEKGKLITEITFN